LKARGLYIKNVDFATDVGDYRCTGVNYLGSSKEEFKVLGKKLNYRKY